MAAFEDFWDAYPRGRRSNKKGCKAKWAAKNLDEISAVIVDDVKWRAKFDRKWLDGYVPMPSTYLNQERWEDDRDDFRDKKADPKGHTGSALAFPEVRRAVIGLIRKNWSESDIARHFAITPDEYRELKKLVISVEETIVNCKCGGETADHYVTRDRNRVAEFRRCKACGRVSWLWAAKDWPISRIQETAPAEHTV